MTRQAPPYLSAFRKQLEDCTQKAVCGREIIQTGRLKQWLQSPSNIPGKSHLQLLLPKEPGSPEPLISQSTLVGRNALVLFSILLHIDRIDCLEVFLEANIVDNQLLNELGALRSRLQEAAVSDADALAESFDTQRWKFCPATLELDGGFVSYREDHILPIVSKNPINEKGGTATLWQIDVLEDFVGERLKATIPRSKHDENDGLGPRYKFALKCFSEENHRQFVCEITAFANLRNHDGMVKCLAHYTQKCQDNPFRTHNLLLEYGDSDLDVYFATYHPPFLKQEIKRFWSQLFEVAAALKDVHNPRTSHDGKKYKGWHADIKPDNILRVNGKFKLADPGFVRFEQDSMEDPRAWLEGCTWTFGAPERRPGTREKVSQKIDIWSLGCVFSIACTWVTGGYSAVRDFIKVRSKGIENARACMTPEPNIPSGDFFHDGSNILSVVTEWHAVLRNNIRRSDPITERVLDLVDGYMLCGLPKDRIDSQMLSERLEKIMEINYDTLSSSMSPSLREALLESDQEANENPTVIERSSSHHRLTDSSGSAKDRKVRKSQILNTPLKKTAHRSEYLTSISKSIRQSNAVPDVPLECVNAQINSLESLRNGTPNSIQNSSSNGVAAMKPRLAPLRRSEAPQKPQNFYQGWNERRRANEQSKFLTLRHHRHPTSSILSKYRHYFNNRDIKFLIDNGSTMIDHWDQADMLLELLVENAKQLDKNGMEVYFTCCEKQLEYASNVKKFHAIMWDPDVVPQEGKQTDIKIALGGIFDGHVDYLQSFRGQKSKLRNLTVIILTDGIWEGTQIKSEVNDKLVNLLRTVRDLRGTQVERHVTLQFVQFGYDADATVRLRYMDDDLPSEVHDFDVIDTEHADGDINKMILGSVVEGYDRLEHSVSSPFSPDASSQAAPLSSPTLLSPTRE